MKLLVRSHFVDSEVDATKLCINLPAKWQFKTDKDGALLRLRASDRAAASEEDSSVVDTADSFVSVFTRGAIVFVNCDWNTCREVFDLAGLAHMAQTAQGNHLEDCVLSVQPAAELWSEFDEGELVVSELHLDNIRVLNYVMAQTVILDYNERRVDRMLETVKNLNRALESQRTEELASASLYNTLSQANDISIRVIMSGLTQNIRPGSTAWKDERFFDLQQQLLEEYELEDRYDHLDRKLSYINDVIKYCLEVQKENKFLRLEKWIVILILAELLVSLVHMPLGEYAQAVMRGVLG